MDPTQKDREAAVITILGEDVLLLYNMSINEEMGRLFSIDIEMISKKDDIDFEGLLGSKVTIRLNLLEGTRYFNGHITQLAQIDRRDSFGGVYQATIQPWLWFLTRRADCQIFQKMTVPEIIQQVLSNWGHSFELKLTRQYRNREYCVQYRETDFDFISRLMEQEGIYYFFEHENGQHKMVIADDYGAHQSVFTLKGRVPLFIEGGGAVREEESCSNWYTKKSILPGTYSLNDYDFERPGANLRVGSNLSKPHSMAEEEIYDYPGRYVESDDGEQYSRNRIEELHSQYEVSHANGDVRGMAAGGLFTLAEHPRKDQNKEYLLISVSHHFQNDDFGAGSSGGNEAIYSNSFTAVDSKVPFRSSQTTTSPFVKGPQTAIVVGPEGDEIYTDKYGRVKVQFHWDRYGDNDENSSCWVRVSQLWAGKNWGGIHIPRIGQEVIIEFLEGDPDRPIITGRVYNADQMPPYDLPANKTQSGIKSRSSKGGGPSRFNEIRFEDKLGAEEIFINAEKDNNIVIGHNQSLHVHNNRSSTIASNDSLSVVGAYSRSVGGSESISVSSNRSANIAKNYSLNIGKDKNQTINKGESLSVGEGRSITVGESEVRSVGSNLTVSVKSNHSITVGGNTSCHSKGNVTQSSDGPQKISSKGNIEIESASGDIVLSAGGSSIKLSKTGNIEINGAAKVDVNGITVNLNCGGAAQNLNNLLSQSPDDISIEDLLRVADPYLKALPESPAKEQIKSQIKYILDHKRDTAAAQFGGGNLPNQAGGASTSKDDPWFGKGAAYEENVKALYLTVDGNAKAEGLLGSFDGKIELGAIDLQGADHFGDSKYFGGSGKMKAMTAGAEISGGVVAGYGVRGKAEASMVEGGVSTFVGTDENNPYAEAGVGVKLLSAEAKGESLLGSDGHWAGIAASGSVGASAISGEGKGEINIPIPFTDWTLGIAGKGELSAGAVGAGAGGHLKKNLKTGRYHAGASGELSVLGGLGAALDLSIGPKYTDRKRD